MTRPDFHAIYPNPLDAHLTEGYYDGRRLDSPEPGANRHPAYVHGFLNGRDDALCASGQRKFPLRNAEESRRIWALIVATEAP